MSKHDNVEWHGAVKTPQDSSCIRCFKVLPKDTLVYGGVKMVQEDVYREVKFVAQCLAHAN